MIKTRETTDRKKKNRLFVDMDGTLTEWRSFHLKIDSIEQKDLVLQKLNKALLSPGYFLSLKPHSNVVDAIREVIKEGYEVFILTCVLEKEETPNPITEKKDWRGIHIPEIDDAHMIFVPDGEDKTKYIPDGVKKGDVTLDDYSPKLFDFEKAGGVGVKLLNEVNESKGSWNGSTISMSEPSEKIAKDLIAILNGEVIKHNSPKKDRTPFAEIDVDTEVEIEL